jgi:peroxiredoxin
MINKIRSCLLSAVCTILFFSGCHTKASDYSIRVHLKGDAPTDSAFLGRFENSKLSIIRKVKISGNRAVFSGERPLRPGMYSAGMGEKVKFNFLLSDTLNQHFDITVEPGKIPASLSFENSAENNAFTAYLKSLDEYGQKLNNLRIRLRRTSWYPDSVNKINASIKQLNAAMAENSSTLTAEFPGSLFSTYISLIRDPEVSEPAIPASAKDPKQFMQDYYYNYITGHFFDNFDFSDPRILSVPVFEEKTGFFFRQMVPPLTDSILYRVEKLLQTPSMHREVYNYLVKYLYRLLRESAVPDLIQASEQIGEDYILPEPDRWNDAPFVEKVRERNAKAMQNKVGTSATALTLQTLSGASMRLSDVKARLTILYFFNPECEACGPITDQLYPLYKKYKNTGIEVFAVYLDRKVEMWKKYISSKNLDWLNVYDPSGSEMIENKYDIYAIPMIYLLDRDKKVVAKDVPVEKLENYLKDR